MIILMITLVVAMVVVYNKNIYGTHTDTLRAYNGNNNDNSNNSGNGDGNVVY